MPEKIIPEILPIPEIPKKIIAAINNKELAVFIGAGVSRLTGCMGWAQLAANLVDCCYKEDIINYKARTTLTESDDHKKTITICYHLLDNSGRKAMFFQQMKQALRYRARKDKPNIYDDIHKLRGLFITTNADKYFDHKRFFYPNNIDHREKDFNYRTIDRTRLYHIHGSISDNKSLVFTVPQYFERYRNKEFRRFLQGIFTKYTVLFLGYGLAEFELLDFLVKPRDTKQYTELQHFVLKPFYSDEGTILECEQLYFNHMNIRVIPYQKDRNGYKQLCEVMKQWSAEINQVSSYLSDSFQDIDEAITNPGSLNIDRALQIAKTAETLEDYLFGELAQSTLPVPWLEPLKERGYLDPSKNPPPEEVSDTGYRIPFWNTLRFVENLADRNFEAPEPVVTDELCSFIESVIQYVDDRSERVDNHYTDWTIIKVISTLPEQSIEDEYIDFVRTALQSKWGGGFSASEIGKTLLPRLVDMKAERLVLRLLDVMLSYKKTDSESGATMEEYWLGDALGKHKQSIAELCPLEAAEIALKNIQSIVKEDKNQFNVVWLTTIEPHQQTSFPDSIENQLVSFVRDMFQFADPDNIRIKVESLIAEEHHVFKRIAIHTINRHFRRLQDLFWNWPDSPLSDYKLHHEVYELLKANCKIFNDDQIDKVLDWIESKEYYVGEQIADKEGREKVIAYRKREYLSALLECENAKVVEKYRKYEAINPTKMEHPGFLTWSEFSWGTVSPVEVNELTGMSNVDIAMYLNGFQEDQRNFRGPTKDGLEGTLRSCATTDPQKFTSELGPFKSVDLAYQSVILSGLSEAWRQGKSLEWEPILDFSLDIIQQKNFRQYRQSDRGRDYKGWVISAIADLIREGTEKKDDRAFSQELLSKAEQILLILVDLAISDAAEERDILTHTLNSSKGKVLSAMITYSVHAARLGEKPKGQRWSPKIKEQFHKRLKRNADVSLEFSAILGQYLRNLPYLDEDWMINNINEIFPKDREEHWRVAFTGYLFFMQIVHKESFFLLRANDHYTKAISTKFLNRDINQRCVQHIVIGFLQDWEKLGDANSLINKLLRNKDTDQLSEIINFLWRIGNSLKSEQESKIRPLWKALVDLLSEDQENPEFQKIILQMSMFLSLFDKIDEKIFRWLKLSAKFAGTDHRLHRFIELLADHVEKTPDYVAQIYREILANDVFPDYPKEKIEQIVERLYQKGERESANRICNMYFEKGFYFLRDLYEKSKENGDE